ncbi:MAG: hypothetical protein IJL87_09410 [Clostridia bacterium]|nr:hypothetical protein [Clostridia bacterium]
MEKINKLKLVEQIKKETGLEVDNFDVMVETEQYHVSHSQIWFDGGFDMRDSLENKMKFYRAAFELLSFLKRFIADAGEEEIYLGNFEDKTNYCDWSNKEEFDCFNVIKEEMDDTHCFKELYSEIGELLDYAVENNLRYLTEFEIYLPKSKTVISPECHTKLIFYSADNSTLSKRLKRVIKDNGFNDLETVKWIGDACTMLDEV